MDPVTIALIGSSLLGLFGAKKQSDAAKKAAETQVDYSREALDLVRGLYEQSRADAAPYMDAGYGAVGRLSAMLGRSPFANWSEGQYSVIPPDAASLQMGPARPAPLPPSRSAQPTRPTSGELPNGVRWSLPGGAGDSTRRGVTPGLSVMMARQQAGPPVSQPGGMVLMRHGVSGDTRWVPADRESEYERQGARRVQ